MCDFEGSEGTVLVQAFVIIFKQHLHIIGAHLIIRIMSTINLTMYKIPCKMPESQPPSPENQLRGLSHQSQLSQLPSTQAVSVCFFSQKPSFNCCTLSTCEMMAPSAFV